MLIEKTKNEWKRSRGLAIRKKIFAASILLCENDQKALALELIFAALPIWKNNWASEHLLALLEAQ